MTEAALWTACTEGDLSTLETLLSNPDINVNWTDPELDRSCFYRACGHGQTLVVKRLLEDKRVDVNLPMRQRATPFYIACQQGHVDVIALLLKDPRVDVTAVEIEGCCPLFVASSHNQVAIVKLLLQDSRTDVNKQQFQNSTPLVIACQEGHLEVVKVLLRHPGINVNLMDSYGATALHVATIAGHVDVVEEILGYTPRAPGDEPLKVNQGDFQGLSPFHLGCDSGHVNVFKALLADPRVDVNLQSFDRITPLWLCCRHGGLEMIQLMLLSRDFVNVNVRTNTLEEEEAAEAELQQQQQQQLLQQQQQYHQQLQAQPPGAQPVVFNPGQQPWWPGLGEAVDAEDEEEEEEGGGEEDDMALDPVDWHNTTSLELAQKLGHERCAALIESYRVDPVGTRQLLRKRAGILSSWAAETFALVVYLSDGYLRFAPRDTTEASLRATRFFMLAEKLPMEMQMMLANRLFGLSEDLILSGKREAGLRSVLEKLFREQNFT